MEQYALTAILLLGFFVLVFSGLWIDREPQAELPARVSGRLSGRDDDLARESVEAA